MSKFKIVHVSQIYQFVLFNYPLASCNYYFLFLSSSSVLSASDRSLQSLLLITGTLFVFSHCPSGPSHLRALDSTLANPHVQIFHHPGGYLFRIIKLS